MPKLKKGKSIIIIIKIYAYFFRHHQRAKANLYLWYSYLGPERRTSPLQPLRRAKKRKKAKYRKRAKRRTRSTKSRRRRNLDGQRRYLDAGKSSRQILKRQRVHGKFSRIATSVECYRAPKMCSIIQQLKFFTLTDEEGEKSELFDGATCEVTYKIIHIRRSTRNDNRKKNIKEIWYLELRSRGWGRDISSSRRTMGEQTANNELKKMPTGSESLFNAIQIHSSSSIYL